MLRATRLAPSPLRSYSTSTEKPSLKLVAELRKLTEVSITKAREALTASNNDVTAALKWLQKDLAVSGAKKAAKVQGRTAGEGLIGVSVLSHGTGSQSLTGHGGVRAAMIELNCETDFVARNELFGRLVADIAHTAAFISEPDAAAPSYIKAVSLDLLNGAPLLSSTGASPQSTVGDAIRDTIAKVGEKVSLQRVVSVARDPLPPNQPGLGLRVASYTHGAVNLPSQGRIASLALLALKSPRLPALLQNETFREDLERIERSLARQIVGFDTRTIRPPPGESDETALYGQPFAMLAGSPTDDKVGAFLEHWAREKGLVVNTEISGLEVLEMERWTVGETTA
ncbi:EF-TsMt 2 [Amylostereum chailletii]|nr:EF-TsMt 2 [Amylostereum chailletii]